MPTLDQPRAGFDVVRLSAPRGAGRIETATVNDALPDLQGYRRRDRELRDDKLYQRIAQFLPNNREEPAIDVLYGARTGYLPAFLLYFRSSIMKLLDGKDLSFLQRASRHLADPFGVQLSLSKIELTTDLPRTIATANDLFAQIDLPGTPLYQRARTDGYYCWGSGASKREFKLYDKMEHGVSLTRSETTVHRDFLRKKGVNRLEDLTTVSLRDFVPVRLHVLPADIDTFEARSWRERIALNGVYDLRQTLTGNARRRFHRTLEPGVWQALFDVLAQSFDEQFKASDLSFRRRNGVGKGFHAALSPALA